MTCINCTTNKPDSEFYSDGEYPLFSHYCRKCRSETIYELHEQHKKQVALMSDEEKNKFFTVINDDNSHLRKTKLPDWMIIDKPGFTPPRSA